MLDLKAIRHDPETVRAALARRRDGSDASLDRVLELDARRRELLPETEALRARQNESSAAIGRAKKEGRDASEEIAAMQEVARRVKALSEELSGVEAELEEALASLPNPPDPTAADEDETDREVGEVRPSGRDHLEVANGLIDMEAGARVAGSRVAHLKGEPVLLELALGRWAMEELGARGFEPVIPPALVREEALYGTGMWPDTEQQIYRLADDALYLVGTSEVPLASLHGGEILGGLPLRYAGFSPCFRREAGAAGRDTRGIFRVHQFDKVEMFSYVHPDDAESEHRRLLEWEKQWLNALELPFQVIDVATGDLGASASRKYDCEAWIPTQGKYRELTSASNCTEFQARRLSVRMRDGKHTRPLATLNGTLCAVPRTIVAILENHQQADGSVRVPEVLRPYLGGREVLEPVSK